MPPDKLKDKYNHVLGPQCESGARREHQGRSRGVASRRGCRRRSGMSTLFWMEGAENWRIACGPKVVGLRRRARPTCAGGALWRISCTFRALHKGRAYAAYRYSTSIKTYKNLAGQHLILIVTINILDSPACPTTFSIEFRVHGMPPHQRAHQVRAVGTAMLQ